MSGGTFEHNEYHICKIAEDIQDIVDYNDAPKTERKFSPETIERFSEAVDLLRRAHILVHRIDYLLAGDDGEDNFHERLQEDLEKYRKWEGENLQLVPPPAQGKES